MELKYLGTRIWFHPLKEQEAMEILVLEFTPPGSVRAPFILSAGVSQGEKARQIAALSENPDFWEKDPDERDTTKLIGEAHSLESKPGIWRFDKMVVKKKICSTPSCGTEIENGANFSDECGTRMR
jgi:hypothetical protein